MRSHILALRWALAIALGSGWLLSVSTAPVVAAPASEIPDLQVRWIGLRNVKAQPNAAPFRSMLDLPQAATLGDQILTKLARAPWSDGTTNAASANEPASALLRPLLQTIFANESYIEVQGGECVLAVRLEERDRALWQSNLPGVLKAWPGLKPSDKEGLWTLTRQNRSFTLRTQSQGNWMLLGISPANHPTFTRTLDRLSRPDPFKSGPTNYWIDAQFDLAWVKSKLHLEFPLPVQSPHVRLTTIGEGEYVRTDAALSFPQPLKVPLEPWVIPTNIIHDPLLSFTAIRGFRDALAASPWFKELNPPSVPNQAYLWSLTSGPMFGYSTVPMPQAKSWLEKSSPMITSRFNAWLKKHNGADQARWDAQQNAIVWLPVPLINPTIQALSTPSGDFLVGRFGPAPLQRGDPPPAELLNRVTSVPDLVYYNWEVTEPRLGNWLFLTQSARVAFDRRQLDGKAPILQFLLAAKGKMGNTVTDVRLTGPSALTLVRKSNSGFTGMEWHLISDWIESPAFPRGLQSLLNHGSGLPKYKDFLQPATPPAKNSPRK